MDAKNILRGFGSWGLSHIRREGNMMAHILAKFVVSSEQMKVRFVFFRQNFNEITRFIKKKKTIVIKRGQFSQFQIK